MVGDGVRKLHLLNHKTTTPKRDYMLESQLGGYERLRTVSLY